MGMRQCAGGLFWLGHFSCPLLFPPTHPPENPTRAARHREPARKGHPLRGASCGQTFPKPCPPLFGESGARRLRPRAHCLCGVAPYAGASAGRLAAICGVLRQPMPSAYARGVLRRFAATNAFGVCSRQFAVWCVPVRMGIVLVRSFFIAHAAPTHQTAMRRTMRQTQAARLEPRQLGPQFPQLPPLTGRGLRKNPWALTPRPAPQKYNIRPYWHAP